MKPAIVRIWQTSQIQKNPNLKISPVPGMEPWSANPNHALIPKYMQVHILWNNIDAGMKTQIWQLQRRVNALFLESKGWDFGIHCSNLRHQFQFRPCHARVQLQESILCTSQSHHKFDIWVQCEQFSFVTTNFYRLCVLFFIFLT